MSGIEAPWVGKTPEEWQEMSNPYYNSHEQDDEPEEEPICYCDDCGEPIWSEDDLHEEFNDKLCTGCWEERSNDV